MEGDNPRAGGGEKRRPQELSQNSRHQKSSRPLSRRNFLAGGAALAGGALAAWRLGAFPGQGAEHPAPTHTTIKELAPVKDSELRAAFNEFAAGIKNTPLANLMYPDDRSVEEVINSLANANDVELRQKFQTKAEGNLLENQFSAFGDVQGNLGNISFQEILDKPYVKNSPNTVVGFNGTFFINRNFQVSEPQPGTEFDIHNPADITNFEHFAEKLGFKYINYATNLPYTYVTDNTTRVWIQFHDAKGQLLSVSPDGKVSIQTEGGYK